VRAMQSNMRELNVILENRTAAQNQIWADRQKREEKLEEQKRARRKRVGEMARQLGIAGDSRLWVGVLKLLRSEEDMESFEEADEERRKCILAHLSCVQGCIYCVRLCCANLLCCATLLWCCLLMNI
jgi:hypothetical protein